MARIPKSRLDIWDTREEVSLRKLAEDAFDQVSFDGLTDVDVLNPDDNDTIFYNFALDLWENHPLKTINGESLKGPGDIVVTGGGGTPGGTSGQFQWNDSGAFGGTSGFTWNSITSQPASASGYTFGGNSSVAENVVGLSTVASMEHRPISGLFASVELESDGSVTSIARLNTTSGATSKFLQVEVDKGSPRYFDGSGFEDVWHTGTFDPSTKQDTITAGTGLAFAGTTLNVSTNLQGWNGITTGSKQDTLVSGTNIKSINGNSLLGSGDLTISGISSISRVITVGFDAGKVNGLDQPLVTGLKFELRAPFGLDPTEWTLLPKGASSGAITIEVRKRPFSSGSFSSITGGSPPSITGGARGTGSATGWTTIDSGDLIEFEITSVTGDVFGITLIVEATEV